MSYNSVSSKPLDHHAMVNLTRAEKRRLDRIARSNRISTAALVRIAIARLINTDEKDAELMLIPQYLSGSKRNGSASKSGKRS